MVKNNQKFHNNLFVQQLKEKKLLVAAHRGISGGNIIGNTIPGFMAALQSGADIIEFDVIKSTDGILYIYHDGTEPFHLHVKQNIKSMSSKRIEKLRYYNSANFYSEFGIERLDNILEEFAGKTLMNIDRAWDIFPDLIENLDQFNVKDHVLIKSPVKNQPLAFLNDFGRDYMFMPIIKKYDEIEKVQQYDRINMIGMELVTKSPEDRLFQDETVSEIKDLGFFAWVNSITFDNKHILYGGLDDNTSIIDSPDKGWGKLIDKGFDIILTDWPGLLNSYREKRFGGKV